ncbi:enolase C-terminal domain-like protein [Pelotalea chapellei]|uniref:Mandelate racemase/muconate lactonizing enzyme C-terminal domain-containing protein n=1 Tax=Pelotalea chapellei TaxID=44671 RepID=A0ABS5U753_9BACT|nr:enolase C-terminal domain-like protein [Pelotalea chapellei]MBT1071500.1 hypothetical protein [Pelotalea chapellei]
MKEPTIERVEARAFRIPTDQPEADGTFRWDATTMVVVQLKSEGVTGLGYTYADTSAACLTKDKLADLIIGRNPCDIPACWDAMLGSLRNLGEAGIGMLAVSAIDVALWDLKARLLDLPLVDLIGNFRDRVPIYGSGGFTTYSIPQLQQQLAGWVTEGIPRVKMKTGSDPGQDAERVRYAREAIGSSAELFVDANGAYGRKQALHLANTFAEQGVTWFEEPVVHHDRQGLRQLRDRAPCGMEIAAGEYGFTTGYFQQMLHDGCVDVLQADASRCGITGFLKAAVLCEAYHLPLSSHCAPALHVHPCCSAEPVRHLEYFHDHARIEQMLFEGVPEPVGGNLLPDRSRRGMGLGLREEESRRYEL